MLESLVKQEANRCRHRSTPVGLYLDGYLEWLNRAGFSTVSLKRSLQHATALGEFLSTTAIDLPQGVTPERIEQFFQWYGASRPKTTHRNKRISADETKRSIRSDTRRLVNYLRNIGVVKDEIVAADDTDPFDKTLSEYISFLRDHRGLADATLSYQRHWARFFLDEFASRSLGFDLMRLSSADVQQIVSNRAKQLPPASTKIMVRVVRNLIFFLRREGYISQSCAPFLPRQRSYALANLPSAISADDVHTLLATADRKTPVGKRNYSMLILLLTYGLRATEVAELRLDDIERDNRLIRIRQTKTRRELTLPLTQLVADCLEDYLRNGRPPFSSSHVFLKAQAPSGPLTRKTLYSVVRRAVQKSGIRVCRYGPHMLRHTAATSWIRKGHSLKVVGDLLGHQTPMSTLQYCKLAVEDLRSVPLEVPGRSP